MPGTILVSGSSSGDPGGSRTFTGTTITGTAQVGETWVQTLSSGDNVITVPTGAVATLIYTPSTAVVLKFRTSLNAGDTGLPLNLTGLPFVYPFPATPPTTITINAASSVASNLTVIFI